MHWGQKPPQRSGAKAKRLVHHLIVLEVHYDYPFPRGPDETSTKCALLSLATEHPLSRTTAPRDEREE